MDVQQNFISMFTDVEGYEEFEKEVQASHKKKRGKYHKHVKIREYNPYTHISELYCAIANYLPIPLGVYNDVVNEIYGLKSWYTIDYDDNNKEQPLKLFQAEIIGTENFNVEDRITLHEKLLSFLTQHVNLENVVKLLKADLQKVTEKYTISEYAQWLKKQREIQKKLYHG